MADDVKDTAAAGTTTPAAAEPAAVTPPVAAAPDTPAVPEKYEFTLPDGSLLEGNVTERITEKAKALKVTDATLAQAFVDVAHTEVEAFRAAYEAAHREDGTAWKATVEANEKAALAHPELGNGDATRLQDVATRAALVLKKYAPDAMPKLKAAALLNEPSVLLLLKNIDEATREPATPAPAATTPVDVPWHKQMYPDGIKV